MEANTSSLLHLYSNTILKHNASRNVVKCTTVILGCRDCYILRALEKLSKSVWFQVALLPVHVLKVAHKGSYRFKISHQAVEY